MRLTVFVDIIPGVRLLHPDWTPKVDIIKRLDDLAICCQLPVDYFIHGFFWSLHMSFVQYMVIDALDLKFERLVKAWRPQICRCTRVGM